MSAINANWKHNPVGVYLMSCFAYEIGEAFLSDAEFDALGMYIHINWDSLEHRHKHLINPECCHYTSGTTQPYRDWPEMILNATLQHVKQEIPANGYFNNAAEKYAIASLI